ncbi:hypothetical protein B0O99DRAFT_559288 [Bisporella sp. PMI_857]|nr:hypothetical protein B0O99DRAFT_559288 [Bisporella sp. PMI_857]
MSSMQGQTTISLCRKSVGRKDAIEELVREYFRDNSLIVSEENSQSGFPQYVLRPGQLNERLGEDQIERLQQLCRLKSRQRVEVINGEQILPLRPRQAPTASSTSGPCLMPQPSSSQTVQRKESDDQPSVPLTAGNAPVHPAKNRPDTLRVQNIPVYLTIEEVVDEVWKNFSHKPQVHSLAPTAHRNSCATVTFPEAEHDFPVVKVKSNKYAKGKHEFQYDAEFEGFTPLNSPNENHADIVVVVGLGTHAFGTFRSPAPDSSKMWLRDFLPEDVENIRVLLYGYNSKVDDSKSIQNVEDIAGTMLERLMNIRSATKTEGVPIIFLGQSLGGLVVQEAIALAQQSKDVKIQKIFQTWHGLVGFGIPIGGLNNPTLLAVTEDKPNKAFIRQISQITVDEPSEYLKDLKRRFEECSKIRDPPPDLLYFWETQYSIPRSRTAESASSILMVAKQKVPGAKHLAIDSDHSGMVKYEHRTAVYIDVRDNIHRMMNVIDSRRLLVE